MASRLWFLAQTTSRLAVNSLSRHSAKPSLVRSYSVRRFLCTDRKPDTLNTASLDTHVDPKVLDKSEETANPPEVSKTPKSGRFTTKRPPGIGKDPDKLIWEGYKIRYKSGHPPKKTRARCKRNSKKAISGSLCPICVNDITITHEDIPLLKQFICPFTGKVIDPVKTGLCRLQQKKLVMAIEKARNIGLLPFTVPRPDIRKS